MKTIEVYGKTYSAIDTRAEALTDLEPVLETWVRAMGPGITAVDVGAHVGLYTLPALAAGAQVIAYEPSDEPFRILWNNVAVNAWGDRCRLRKYVLWNNDEPYPGELRRQVFTKHYPTTDCDFHTLDDDLGQLGIKRVDVIKLDPEGAELGILLGARRVLLRDRPLLIIENHENASPDPHCEVSRYPERIHSSELMRALLEPLGYRITVVPWGTGRRFWVCEVPK